MWKADANNKCILKMHVFNGITSPYPSIRQVLAQSVCPEGRIAVCWYSPARCLDTDTQTLGLNRGTGVPGQTARFYPLPAWEWIVFEKEGVSFAITHCL